MNEEMKLRRWLNALREVETEYQGYRTMSRVISDIESRLKFYERAK